MVRLQREQARTRRLHPGEEERLLAAAGSARDIIVAAHRDRVSAGRTVVAAMASGAVHAEGRVVPDGGEDEDRADRRVPMSSVLKTILERRRLDPAGDPLPPEGYVFGDQIGRQVGRSRPPGW